MKRLMIFCMLASMMGCGNPSTDQKINYLDSRDCFFISTYVWYDSEIVYSDYECVTIDSLKVKKERKMKKAESVRLTLEEGLK